MCFHDCCFVCFRVCLVRVCAALLARFAHVFCWLRYRVPAAAQTASLFSARGRTRKPTPYNIRVVGLLQKSLSQAVCAPGHTRLGPNWWIPNPACFVVCGHRGCGPCRYGRVRWFVCLYVRDRRNSVLWGPGHPPPGRSVTSAAAFAQSGDALAHVAGPAAGAGPEDKREKIRHEASELLADLDEAVSLDLAHQCKPPQALT
jgi:hypothetical protein